MYLLLLTSSFVFSKKKKPILSRVQVRGVQGDEGDESTVPVLASLVKDGSIFVALGNPTRPQFEKVVCQVH